MNHQNENDRDIQQLLQRVFPEEVPSHTEQRMKNQFAEFRQRFESSPSKSIAWLFFSHRLVGSGVVLLGIFIFILSFTLFQSPGANVYAAAFEALQSVRTIQMHGWSDRLATFVGIYASGIADASKPFQIDVWEWFNEEGNYRSYKRGGPYTVREDGDLRYEYNRDTDTLWIKKSNMDLLEKVPLASIRLLKTLNEKKIKKTDLGRKTLGNQICWGLMTEKDAQRREYWFTVDTHLPAALSFYDMKDNEWVQNTSLQFDYDQTVPQSVRTDTGPEKPKQIHYDWDVDPRFESWRQRLRELAAKYQTDPLPDGMELIPRSNQDTYPYYTYGQMPGIDGYSVRPLQTSLGDYLRSQNYYGTISVPQEFQLISLNSDLILKNTIPVPEQTQFILNAVGLEIVDVTEERMVWMARYDGRPLKPWREVKAPVIGEPGQPLKPGMSSGSEPASITDLVNAFNYWLDYDLTANALYIVDETGLPKLPDINANREPIAICALNIYWAGDDSITIARKWFQEEFGITFTEESRSMMSKQVRKKEK